jgi:hypothetical protein
LPQSKLDLNSFSDPNMSPSDEDEENEFYDAMEETAQPNFILKIPLGHRRPSSAGSQVSRERLVPYKQLTLE